MTNSPRDARTTEANVRMEFWLRESGTFPDRDTLRRIRQYQQEDRRVRASTADPRREQVAGAYPKDTQ